MVSFEKLTDEQQYAATTHEQNITLTAGAGTGKTTTLTERYLRIIERSIDAAADPDDERIVLPEEILTTTFTEKGANELEESIRTAITDRLESANGAEFAAWRRVADGLDDGYIHTLHGFCSRVLREHALAVDGVTPGFETLDEDGTQALIYDTVDAVLEQRESDPIVETLARQFSRSQLQAILADLLTQQPDGPTWADSWAETTPDEYLEFVRTQLHPIERDEAAQRLSAPAFVDAAETLIEIITDPPAIETGGQAWTRAADAVAVLTEHETFDDGVPTREKRQIVAELSQALTTSNGDQYSSYTGATSNWNGHERKADFDAAITTIVARLEPEAHTVSIDWEAERNSVELIQALAQLTRAAATEYEERKRQQNALDFSDLISTTVAILDPDREPETDATRQIRTALQEQFAYVMVDEAQDTDPRQWAILQALTTSSGTAFDAENVFVVGDTKQSIYRFRNADVAEFQETAQQLGTDRDDQLSTNFRTLPGVLGPINTLFKAIFTEDGPIYEAAPQSLTPDRSDPADIATTEYLLVPTNEELRAACCADFDEFARATPDDDAELEAMALAARLSQVLETYQVYPEETDTDDDTADTETPPEPRAIEPSDIAILIRSRTNLKQYERALEAVDIPYSVASGTGFYETPEITALLNLFRALSDPTDDRALYGVLRSPLFGCTDKLLAPLAVTDDSLWEALKQADDEHLADAFDLLTKWQAASGVTAGDDVSMVETWSELLSMVIDDTGYLVSVSAGERPRQAVANIEKFREQLRAWSEDGVASLTMLVRRIERRIEVGGNESEAETTGITEGVQIMTIHNAKGMEFPFVVVPGLSRTYKNDAALGNGAVEFEKVGDQYAVGLKAPDPEEPFDTVDTLARQTLRDQRQQEERAEEKRILYVAMTRARDHLLLCGRHRLDSDVDDATEEPVSLTDIEPPAEDPVNSWRSLVQPELLPESVLTDLESHDRVTQQVGDHEYTVSLPTPPADRTVDDDLETPPVSLSATPSQPPAEVSLSATNWAKLQGGYGELVYDEATRTVVFQPTEGGPDKRHGEPETRMDLGNATQADTGTATASPDEIGTTAFGELVHRLCELRAPEDRWKEIMQQTLAAIDADGQLTEEIERDVTRHAQRGIAYVEQIAENEQIEQQYDELYVTAEFENGSISGFIDHLAVTPETYHIVDYKTGSMTTEDVAKEGEYYAEQLRAYAVALHQQWADKDVQITLVFTDIDTVWNEQFTSAILSSIESDIGEIFQSKIKSL